MAEFLHEVVRKRELLSRELPPALEEWIQNYPQPHRLHVGLRQEFVERILGNLGEGSDNADV